jgi:hypothetical protein
MYSLYVIIIILRAVTVVQCRYVMYGALKPLCAKINVQWRYI